ncbi:MAG: hypothetical protein WAN22_18625, partial [Solirubrobacteraceae bacterium]
MSPSPAAASALPIKTIGNSGPTPPLPVEPVKALNTLAVGDDPSLVVAAGADEAAAVPPAEACNDAPRGAVACA